jgi:hypothetical protein
MVEMGLSEQLREANLVADLWLRQRCSGRGESGDIEKRGVPGGRPVLSGLRRFREDGLRVADGSDRASGAAALLGHV